MSEKAVRSKRMKAQNDAAMMGVDRHAEATSWLDRDVPTPIIIRSLGRQSFPEAIFMIRRMISRVRTQILLTKNHAAYASTASVIPQSIPTCTLNCWETACINRTATTTLATNVAPAAPIIPYAGTR